MSVARLDAFAIDHDHDEASVDAFDFGHQLFLANRSHLGLFEVRAKGHNCPEGTLLSPYRIVAVASFR